MIHIINLTLTSFSRSQGSIVIFLNQIWNMAHFHPRRYTGLKSCIQIYLHKVHPRGVTQVTMTFIKAIRAAALSHGKFFETRKMTLFELTEATKVGNIHHLWLVNHLGRIHLYSNYFFWPWFKGKGRINTWPLKSALEHLKKLS